MNQKITLLDGTIWNKEELISRMYDDKFYYGYLGGAALSSSSAKKLLDSPKKYTKSLKSKKYEDHYAKAVDYIAKGSDSGVQRGIDMLEEMPGMKNISFLHRIMIPLKAFIGHNQLLLLIQGISCQSA